MIVNNHRKHSSFAIQNFLAGGCHTYDGAYCLLYAQREQIKMDVAAGDAAVLKQKADLLELDLEIEELSSQLKEVEESTPSVKRLQIELYRKQAEKIRLEAALENFSLNYEGAKRELQELDAYLDYLKPLCKYWNEDILQMEQDMQHDEWREELKSRAENMLLASRLGLPYDHLTTMRQHPDFVDHILPKIAETNLLLRKVDQNQSLAALKELSSPIMRQLPPSVLALQKPSDTEKVDQVN